MTNLRARVGETLRYAAFFDFPLTGEEIHRWLVTDKPVNKNRVERVLSGGKLPQRLRRFYLPKLSSSRLYRQKMSEQKKDKARKVAKVLALIPGVKLVALTGSAAIGNSRAGDDIDLMIVASGSSLWLIRPLVVIMVEIFFKRRRPQQKRYLSDVICLNLWLDQEALAVPPRKRNLYTTHEVLQLQPLVNKGLAYEQFLFANRWVSQFLANAYEEKRFRHSLVNYSKRSSIWSGLNRVAFLCQYHYMKRRITKETISLHAAYFHSQDWHKSMSQYFNRQNKKIQEAQAGTGA